ncbi:MAG: calcium-binding protein, partial [Rhizorhabdus sp.]
MQLGATSHFSQGWDLSLLDAAAPLGVRHLRDEIGWASIEKVPGVYDFSSLDVAYVDRLLSKGFMPTLVFQGGNPLYDGGATPFTAAGRAAFADFVAATVQHFQGVRSIEVGNEFNSNDFVSGPVRDSDYALRDDYYLALLEAVHSQVKAIRPDVQILGGAAHSIPVGYFEPLIANGALGLMDGIVIHPYTSEPEELAKQLDVFRTAMGGSQLPIYATEFSKASPDAEDNAGYLVKMATVMAAAGVAGADWYGLREEGGGGTSWYTNQALLTLSGAITPAGRAFAFEQTMLLNRGTPERIAVDDFTFAYRYGSDALVIWGAQRDINVAGPARYFDAQGREIAKPTAIDPDEPLIVISDGPISYGTTFTLGASGLVADSFTQFDFTNEPTGAQTFEGPWSYFVESVVAGSLTPLYTQGGGEVAWSNWTPYLGSDWLRPLSLGSRTVSPVDFGTPGHPNVFKIVERYTASEAASVTIKTTWDVIDTSVDGIDLTIKHNGVAIYAGIVRNVAAIDLPHVVLARGDTLDFVTGTNGTPAGGDATDHRIQIYTEDPIAAPIRVGGIMPPPGTPGPPVADNVVHGSPAADVMIGTAQTNALYGEGGDDVLFGNWLCDFLDGGDGNDLLLGGEQADVLVGGAGSDVLIGGTGADIMSGGPGDEIYVVDDSSDQVIELPGGGHDRVLSSTDYSLPENVEDLSADGSTGLVLVGNGLANMLIGGSGADTLAGGGGDDTLIGGGGGDRFRFTQLADRDYVLDFDPAEGDRIDLGSLLAGIPGASLAASLADYVDVVPYAYGTGIQVRADPGMAF